MQRELNRARQGLREHRIANRPKTAYAEGVLSEDDIEAFKNHPVNAMIAIAGLQPGTDINTVLQAIKGAPIDPNLYEVNPIFQDLMRAVGVQEADLGGTGGDTATESSIAASAKASATGSSVDDIDETLTAIASAAGQILLLNVGEETVKTIVGPGAMWPTLTKAEVARDLYLEIEAGSSGRPNQAQELQNFERLAPILMQLPGGETVVPCETGADAAGRQGRRRRGDRRRASFRDVDERRQDAGASRCRRSQRAGAERCQQRASSHQRRRRNRRHRSPPRHHHRDSRRQHACNDQIIVANYLMLRL